MTPAPGERSALRAHLNATRLDAKRRRDFAPHPGRHGSTGQLEIAAYPEEGPKPGDVIAWEAPRVVPVKCLPGFDGPFVEERAGRIENAAREVLGATQVVGLHTNQGRIGEALRALSEALDA